jgi:hypothetical protein
MYVSSSRASSSGRFIGVHASAHLSMHLKLPLLRSDDALNVVMNFEASRPAWAKEFSESVVIIGSIGD